MSHLLDTSDAGCASLDAFARNRGLATGSMPTSWRRGDTEGGRIQRTIAYMREHLTERMQVGRLASLINVSPSYYFALFKKETGYAPIDFFIHLRMRQACMLLESTTLSVKQIADELGYDDAFYFSRLFKSVTSMAPTEYRLLKRDSKESLVAEVLPERFLGGDLSVIQNGKSTALRRKTGRQAA